MGCPWLMGLTYSNVCFTIACFFLLRSLLFQKKKLLVNWPLVGMLPSVLLNVHRLMDWSADILLANGCTVLFEGPWFSGMKVLLTCDPRNLAHILGNAHFSNYNKGDSFTEIFDILGDGILAADDGSWKIQRKIAHSLFRNKRFRQLVAKTNQDKVEKGLVPVLQTAVEEARPIDLQNVMKRFTFDATSILVCGADPGCLSIGLPTVPFAQALDDVNEVIVLRHTVPKFWRKLLKRLNMGMEKKHSDAWVIIDEYIEKKISTRREELQSRTLPPNNLEKEEEEEEEEEEEVADLLTLYMEYEMREEEMANLKSPNTFLRDTTTNMLLAGRDTTSAALTWFFWLLSKNPSVEARILQELSSIPNPNPNPTTNKPRVFTSEKLGGLVYLHAALYESLRLFPPLPLNHKGVVAPDILPSGHQVKPGMIIIYSIYAMGRMETIWGIDCLEFRPERWISEQGVITLDHRDKFFVFNTGPRSCLGKDISFAQMKAVVAALLYNFQLEVLQDQVVSPKTATTLHTKNGLMVKIRERAVAAA